jgi:hypothetical protein
MTHAAEVKAYLAHWFQLGKRIVFNNGQKTLFPDTVFLLNGVYSPDFENCWQEIQILGPEKCHLEGTVQTIAELLSEAWEFNPCARCAMPVPMSLTRKPVLSCPCHDLEGWPNYNLPLPRPPVDTQAHLRNLLKKLKD